MGIIGWILSVVGGIFLLIIIIKIISSRRNKEDGGIWSSVESMCRGACKKITKLFGC